MRLSLLQLKLADYIRASIAIWSILILQNIYSQTLKTRITNYNGKIYLLSIEGEKTTPVDSVLVNGEGVYQIELTKDNFHPGLYRIAFDRNKYFDFVNDNEEISIRTDAKSVLDSLKVIKSENNKLFYSFLKLNKEYKTKTELLLLMLAKYPKDDSYYEQTKKRLREVQNEYIEFVNVRAQKNPNSFAAKYISSAQLPIIDNSIPAQAQLNYLKLRALDNVNFKNTALINSDLFTNKTIEYLTYYRNPQLPKELLEKEFLIAVDTILNKAKVHQLVYQHITEYLIDGFKKFGFDSVLDYIVENYVIKDDLCLDIKTEGLIKRRIEQAKKYKTGSEIPNISITDKTGKEISLANFHSEKTLIVFYASWCPHCKELLPKLNELKKDSIYRNIEILAISLDTKKEEWINFIDVNCSSLKNVSDLKGWDGQAAIDYYIYATPTMFLLDKNLRVISKPITFEELRSKLN